MLQGEQVSTAIRAQGHAVVLSMDMEGNIADPERIANGCVAVVEWASSEVSMIIDKCAALVAERGGLTCHCAIRLREARKPGVFNVDSATKIIRYGDLVIIEGTRVMVVRVID